MCRESMRFSLWDTRDHGLFPKHTGVVNREGFAMSRGSFRALEKEYAPVRLAPRHSHWFPFYPMLNCPPTFLHLQAPQALPSFFATTGALSSVQGALRTLTKGNEQPPCYEQVSLVHGFYFLE